jgi:hypothetical protein
MLLVAIDAVIIASAISMQSVTATFAPSLPFLFAPTVLS